MMSILQLNQINKTFGKGDRTVHAVNDVSLCLEPGDFTAVRGPSGCGKTTLLLVAGGLLRPDVGEVKVKNESLYAMATDARAAFRARHIGFVFQQFHLIPYLTVLENVLAPCIHGRLEDSRSHARALLLRFGIDGHADKQPATLSTGERQRVALARAMINRPALLLADEPTGNLDEENAAIVLNAMADFVEEDGAVLLVTHDRSAAERATRVIAMQRGRCTQDSS